MFFRKKGQSSFFYRDKGNFFVYVLSDKVTVFRSYLRKGYDFRLNYEKGAPILLDKELVGDTPEDKVIIHAEFDGSYRVISSEIHGGRFLTPKEYEELSKQKEEQK